MNNIDLYISTQMDAPAHLYMSVCIFDNEITCMCTWILFELKKMFKRLLRRSYIFKDGKRLTYIISQT